MTFDIVAALISGFVAVIVMSAIMKMAHAAGMTEMPSFEIMTGSMISGDERKAKLAGAFIHYLMMGTVVFGIAYAALFAYFGSASWLMGLVIGLVHGFVIGALFMPLMPAMHPRMADGGDRSQRPGEVHVSSPGFMGNHWGAMTPAGVLMGHAIYGVVLALVYQAVV